MTLINNQDKNLSIQRQCELLGIARSSYYYEPSAETGQNLSLMRKIDELHLKYPFYGVLRMHSELSTEQAPVNEKRIRRLMRKMGMETVYPKRNLSKPCKWNLRFPYLLRGLDIDKPNRVWSTDITYIPMERGFMYLCAVIDWHSRCILSWELSNTLTTDFCLGALNSAIDKYGCPEILNTDQGSQFTADVFTGGVLEKGIRLSMDGRGRATDNIAIERFWRSLKYEDIYLYSYENSFRLYQGIEKYIRFYNEERKHQGLKNKTPKSIYDRKDKFNPVTAFTTENFLHGPEKPLRVFPA